MAALFYTQMWFRRSIEHLNTTSHLTAWKMSKYKVFSGPYFPAFGLNTERYGVSLCIQSKCGKTRTRKNFVFGHFLRSVCVTCRSFLFDFLLQIINERNRLLASALNDHYIFYVNNWLIYDLFNYFPDFTEFRTCRMQPEFDIVCCISYLATFIFTMLGKTRTQLVNYFRKFDNKKNYQKLMHDVGNKTKWRSRIFGKILNFRIYFPKSIIRVNIKILYYVK